MKAPDLIHVARAQYALGQEIARQHESPFVDALYNEVQNGDIAAFVAIDRALGYTPTETMRRRRRQMGFAS